VARPGSNKSLALGDAIICVNIKMHAGNVIAYPLEKQPLATGTVKGAVLGVFLASSSARPDGNFPKGRGGLAIAVRHIQADEGNSRSMHGHILPIVTPARHDFPHENRSFSSA